jgi:type IV secretion system protein VirB10
MRVATSSDPRLESMFGGGNFSEASARPVVAIGRKGLPTWAFALIAGLAAILLFVGLESRRRAAEPQEGGSKPSAFQSDPPPPLVLPQQYAPGDLGQVPQPQLSTPMPDAGVPGPLSPGRFRPVISQGGSTAPPPAVSPSFGGWQGGGAMVIDSGGVPGGISSPTGASNSAAMPNAMQMGSPAARMRASKLANPAYTVSQGVLIPAVLETAFHSTSAGYARAIVSRDVRGFDGTNVLIPRGSRLIGEYRGTIGPGQNRAMINWTRLIRGDGVTISLNSPAVDPQGRGGIRGKVNTHLFERITDSLLQSTVGLAGSFLRSSRNNVVVAVPGGATDALPDGASASAPPRSLTVPAGTSISVFVAQDLEFLDEDHSPMESLIGQAR